MSEKIIGLKEIAYKLNLSVNAVSRALRDKDDISENTKKRVRQMAYELGYLPNIVSQFIKKGNKPLIAIILNSFKNSFFSECCQKIVSIASQQNFDFTILYGTSHKMTVEIVKQSLSQRVDGIISLIEPETEAIKVCNFHQIHLVLIGRYGGSEPINQVYTDDITGGYLVGQYFQKNYNFDNFVYIQNSDNVCSNLRLEGFKSSINSSNPNANILVFHEHDLTKINTLITKGYRAIFCYNDEVAYDLINQFKLPSSYLDSSIQIIGYDGLSTRINGLIDLTSVNYDYDLICESAFNILTTLLNNKQEKCTSIQVPVNLHISKNSSAYFDNLLDEED